MFDFPLPTTRGLRFPDQTVTTPDDSLTRAAVYISRLLAALLTRANVASTILCPMWLLPSLEPQRSEMMSSHGDKTCCR